MPQIHKKQQIRPFTNQIIEVFYIFEVNINYFSKKYFKFIYAGGIIIK